MCTGPLKKEPQYLHWNTEENILAIVFMPRHVKH